MTLLDSWTSTTSTAATTATTTVPRAVAAGRFVALAITTNAAVTHNTLTDPRGNTWVRDYQQTYTTIFTTSLWRCRLANGLQANDALTLTASASVNRRAFVAGVWDDVSTGALDASAPGAASQSTATATAGPTPATTGDTLVLLVTGSTGNGLLTTPNGGLAMVGAIASNGGSAERSAGLAYGYRTGAAAQTASGGLAASATWLAGVAAYRYAVVTPTSPTATLWNGTSEVSGSWSQWDGAAEQPLTFGLA